MKKIRSKSYSLRKSDQVKKQHDLMRIANANRHNKLRKKILRRYIGSYIEMEQMQLLHRRRIFRSISAKFKFNKNITKVTINGEFGVEDGLDRFLDLAESLVDFNAKELAIYLDLCTRVWPSAITLLCSLKQWVELITTRGPKPVISSSKPDDQSVYEYLCHCGFTDYVKVNMGKPLVRYSNDEIVKIRREYDEKGFDDRLDELEGLLKKYTVYNDDEIEKFVNVALQEIFINITEHGLSHRDRGWWMLAQYHGRHSLISLCMADNGIGFRNTLMSGPQAQKIEEKLRNDPLEDGKFINLAMSEHVSGAIEAPDKVSQGFLKPKRFPKGGKRGRGLDLIKGVCLEMQIQLTILSQHGYYSIDMSGRDVYFGSRRNRIMAGTMYHLLIPARGIIDG